MRSSPPLGGTGAAADDGASAVDAEACDDEAMAPLAAMLSCDMPASTHAGELWRAHAQAAYLSRMVTRAPVALGW